MSNRLFTSKLTLSALDIAEIHRRRWEIELFFRWIKHDLRLRGFFGTSPRDIAVQIWIAICGYLPVAISKRESALPGNLQQVLQIASNSAVEKNLCPDYSPKIVQPTPIPMNILIC